MRGQIQNNNSNWPNGGGGGSSGGGSSGGGSSGGGSSGGGSSGGGSGGGGAVGFCNFIEHVRNYAVDPLKTSNYFPYSWYFIHALGGTFVDLSSGRGTITAIVEKGNSLYALTCAHVASWNAILNPPVGNSPAFFSGIEKDQNIGGVAKKGENLGIVKEISDNDFGNFKGIPFPKIVKVNIREMGFSQGQPNPTKITGNIPWSQNKSGLKYKIISYHAVDNDSVTNQKAWELGLFDGKSYLIIDDKMWTFNTLTVASSYPISNKPYVKLTPKEGVNVFAKPFYSAIENDVSTDIYVRSKGFVYSDSALISINPERCPLNYIMGIGEGSPFEFYNRPSSELGGKTVVIPTQQGIKRGAVLGYSFFNGVNYVVPQTLVLSVTLTPGDSGAPVLLEGTNIIVGIVIGSGDQNYSYIEPIKYSIEKLNYNSWDGKLTDRNNIVDILGFKYIQNNQTKPYQTHDCDQKTFPTYKYLSQTDEFAKIAYYPVDQWPSWAQSAYNDPCKQVERSRMCLRFIDFEKSTFKISPSGQRYWSTIPILLSKRLIHRRKYRPHFTGDCPPYPERQTRNVTGDYSKLPLRLVAGGFTNNNYSLPFYILGGIANTNYLIDGYGDPFYNKRGFNLLQIYSIFEMLLNDLPDNFANEDLYIFAICEIKKMRVKSQNPNPDGDGCCCTGGGCEADCCSKIYNYTYYNSAKEAEFTIFVLRKDCNGNYY